ncbi:hypothetical protein AVEN_102989-1 [Araneus ventricosus]|uniref:Secreted protein n=1 Tax=Araneus ventricosus TaxID=182803 RepID=A0A4Y2BAL6_ARAVE|nr:hypothetical protein AVEN_102989-1 [Araneus ventricosus]
MHRLLTYLSARNGFSLLVVLLLPLGMRDDSLELENCRRNDSQKPDAGKTARRDTAANCYLNSRKTFFRMTPRKVFRTFGSLSVQVWH